MKHIKNFNENEEVKIQLTRVSDDINNSDQVDEGVKEWILSGALALASAGGLKAQKATTINLPKNQEYVSQETKSDTTLSINFGSEFESGTYRFSKDKAKETEVKLNQITDFVKKFNGSNITISIEGSESQVPNIDRETGKRLPKGGLSKMRVAETQDLINSHLDSLVGKGIFKGKYDTTTKIGPTTYKLGENPGQEKFTKEQYVKVTIKASGKSEQKVDKFAAYSQMGDRVFNSNKHAIGDIYFKTRETKDVKDAGNTDTGHEDVLLKTIDKMGNYDGHTYLIPSAWWNKTHNYNTLSDDLISYIKTNFEVK